MKALELFSGTYSFGKEAKKYNFDVISVDLNTYKDIDPPTHQVDILKWNYKIYPKNYFKIIWASPPCVNYSTLQYGWYNNYKKINGKKVLFTKEVDEENMKQSDILVKKTLEIIEYFSPEYFIIENPFGSRIKYRGLLDFFPCKTADYCKYSDWGYRKRTNFWTNIDISLQLCNKDCGQIINKKHKINSAYAHGGTLSRYRIPPKLIQSFLNKII